MFTPHVCFSLRLKCVIGDEVVTRPASMYSTFTHTAGIGSSNPHDLYEQRMDTDKWWIAFSQTFKLTYLSVNSPSFWLALLQLLQRRWSLFWYLWLNRILFFSVLNPITEEAGSALKQHVFTTRVFLKIYKRLYLSVLLPQAELGKAMQLLIKFPIIKKNHKVPASGSPLPSEICVCSSSD